MSKNLIKYKIYRYLKEKIRIELVENLFKPFLINNINNCNHILFLLMYDREKIFQQIVWVSFFHVYQKWNVPADTFHKIQNTRKPKPYVCYSKLFFIQYPDLKKYQTDGCFI
jgi:hypothetical protein